MQRPLDLTRSLNSRLTNQINLWKGRYTIIAKHSDIDDLTEDRSVSYEEVNAKARWKRLCSRSVVVAALATVLICEITVLVFLPHNATGSPKLSSATTNNSDNAKLTVAGNRGCGNNYETATSADCRFDPLTIAWETPTCRDPYTDIIQDFIHHSEWSISTDAEGLDQVSWNNVSHGLQRYHAEWDYHFTHCIYAWKMMQRAFEERLPLADNLLDMKHTRHCLEVLQDERWSAGDTHTLIHVKWPKCYGYAEWAEASYSDQFT